MEREPVEIGVTYWSAEVGPYVWHEFDADRTAVELHAIAASGHRFVRTHLLWDAFLPTPRRVEPARLRDLERFLDLASGEALGVVPVLYAQSLNGCVMLPAYAIEVDAPRSGVRVVTDAVTQPGGPRDLYTDPLMVEVSLRWIGTMLGAFAGHPAIVAWDLGHDPATTIRPRRTDEFARWLSVIAMQVHDHGQRCMLTLGSDDITVARGMRPHTIASAVDMVGLELRDGVGDAVESGLDSDAVVFLAHLAQALTGAVALMVHLGVGDAETAPPQQVRRHTVGVYEGLVGAGCAALAASMWSEPGPRARDVPPFDAHRRRACGVVDASGASTPFGDAWIEQVRRERERAAPAPWPDHLDSDGYYANMPDSLHDLYVAWRRGASEQPAML